MLNRRITVTSNPQAVSNLFFNHKHRAFQAAAWSADGNAARMLAAITQDAHTFLADYGDIVELALGYKVTADQLAQDFMARSGQGAR